MVTAMGETIYIPSKQLLHQIQQLLQQQQQTASQGLLQPGQQGQQQQQPLQGLLQPVTQLVQGLLGGLSGGGQQGQQEQQPGLPVKQSNTRGLLQRTGKVYD